MLREGGQSSDCSPFLKKGLFRFGARVAPGEMGGEFVKRFSWLRKMTAAALLFLAGTVAYAYEVSPMRVFLVPASGQSQGTIAINNTREQPLPVEMRVLRRVIAEDGTQSFVPADDDFIIFPPQFQVSAGNSQAVRFQYIGNPQVAESQGYVMQVAEVPVRQPGASGFSVVYNFGVAVYVDPPRASERLTVESAEVREGRLHLRVRNAGNKYGYINDNGLRIDRGGQSLDLSRDQAAERIENPLIPPNFTRTFEFAVPELTAPGTVTVRLRGPMS